MAHDKIGPREAQLRAQREARFAKSQARVVEKVKAVKRPERMITKHDRPKAKRK